MLPDDYFSFCGDWSFINNEPPDFSLAECVTNFGASEGIYLDITLIYYDEATRKNKRINFATGKHYLMVQMPLSECHGFGRLISAYVFMLINSVLCSTIRHA
jgi:hypothetical protein